MQTFQEIFSQSSRAERSKLAVPKEMIEGWIHLLMGLVHLANETDKSDRLLEDAKTLIRSGMAIVVNSLSEKSLINNSIVLPLELLSLVSLKLLQDITLGKPDISECYSASLETMVGRHQVGIIVLISKLTYWYRKRLLHQNHPIDPESIVLTS